MIVGTYGYEYPLITGLDLSNATQITVTILRPDATQAPPKQLGATAVANAATGTIYVPIASGDLTVVGLYIILACDTSPGVYNCAEPAEEWVGDVVARP